MSYVDKKILFNPVIPRAQNFSRNRRHVCTADPMHEFLCFSCSLCINVLVEEIVKTLTHKISRDDQYCYYCYNPARVDIKGGSV